MDTSKQTALFCVIDIFQENEFIMCNDTRNNVSIFWDFSNIYIPALDVAKDRDGVIAARDLRIQFDALYDLARNGRDVVAGVCVGSIQPSLGDLLGRLRDVGVELELFERGRTSGREQAVDQALQVQMLRALADQPPGVAVLLTGDGAGYNDGKGYFADLERMHAKGWSVEVLSWNDACHHKLRE